MSFGIDCRKAKRNGGSVMLHRTGAILLLVGLLALLQPTLHARAAPVVSVQRATFPLHAMTEAGLLAELRARGPLVGGRRSFARTRMKSSLSTLFRKTPKGCRVRRQTLTLRYTILLPRALNERHFPKGMKQRWRAFLRHLARHENRHITIWTGCARKAERRIRHLKATSCAELDRKARAAWRRAMRSCDRLHDAFDLKERKAALQHPFLRSALGLDRRSRRHAAR